jgi:hypothetical protein
MNITEKRKLLLDLIREYLNLLNKSMDSLIYSYGKCLSIGVKNQYNLEDQEIYEALTSRFARTSDILTQKVIKTFFMLIQEDIRTVIDGANLLEKLSIVTSADDLLNIREIRNQIAHEYVENELGALYQDVLQNIPLLQKINKKLEDYINEKLIATPL